MTDIAVSDKQQRSDALDINQSFIVQAPAGSGKTSLLIARYICLLATVDEPEEVLAVTFTSKATHEMRKRILEALDPQACADLKSDDANRALATVQRRSKERDWDLQHQPSRLQIMTIDALCAKMVREMPWASRFGAVPEMATSEVLQEIYRVAAANTIELKDTSDPAIRKAVKLVLKRSDNNIRSLQDLFVKMLGSRDQWLNHITGVQGIDLRRREFLEQNLLSAAVRMIDMVRGHFGAKHIDDLEFLSKGLVANMLKPPAELAKSLKAIADGDLRLEPGSNFHESRSAWLRVAELLITKDGKWRKRMPVSSLLHAKPVKESFQNTFSVLIGTLRPIHGLDEMMAGLRNCPDPAYADDDWECLEAIFSILHYLVAQLHLEFRRRGLADFIEVAQRATFALGTPEAPTDLSLVMDYRLKHILIDEFQDTSLSQERLLLRLIGGWQDGEGRTLFVVGDPMQSIYRFREAEVGIFLRSLVEGVGDLKLKPIVLSQNFRSTAGLVDWFNKVFKAAFPASNDADSGSVSYAESTPNTTAERSGSPGIRIFAQQGDADRDRSTNRQAAESAAAKRLVEDLSDFLARSDSAEKAAILLRYRKTFEALRPHLEAAEIPFYARDLVSLKDRQAVLDVLSLTRALSDLSDRASWFALLRAPWCGLDLADLLRFGESECIWDAIEDDDLLAGLTEPGRKRIKRLRAVMEQSFMSRGRMGVRQHVEDTWTALGGPACVSDSDMRNVDALLDLIEERSDGTEVSYLDRFEQFMSDLYAVPETDLSSVRVQIMTIHSAKGLEFDAVFLPGLDRRGRGSARQLMLWEETFADSDKSALLLSPVSHLHGENSAIHNYLKQRDAKKEEQELLRLTYVACTRAKRELYLYGCVGKASPPKGSMLNALWDAIDPKPKKYMQAKLDKDGAATDATGHSESGLAAHDVDDRQELNSPVLHRLRADWQIPMPPASLFTEQMQKESPGSCEEVDFDWAGDIARWVGTVVHEWLQKISMRGIERWDLRTMRQDRPLWTARLKMLGVEADRVDQASDRVERLLTNVLDDDVGRWLLSGAHHDARSEWRLTGGNKGDFRNLILDRTFVDESGTRWIVDYKTGYTDGDVEQFLDEECKRYYDQLQKYGEFVSHLESRPIRLGLYFPSHKGWREWPYHPSTQPAI